jgi:NAD(P)-dependent dehydrogenase (short-subunit alcohol dehydrogenase family)
MAGWSLADKVFLITGGARGIGTAAEVEKEGAAGASVSNRVKEQVPGG